MMYQPEYMSVMVPVYPATIVYEAPQSVSHNSYDSGYQVFDQLPGVENGILCAENDELRGYARDS